MILKYFILSSIFACIFTSAVFAETKQSLTVGVIEKTPLHEMPSMLSALPRPFISYHFESPSEWKFAAFSAVGLLNRLEAHYYLSPRLSLVAKAETFLIFYSDQPRDNGNDYQESYDFNGHRFTGFFGPTLESGSDDFKVVSRLNYRIDQFYFYSFTSRVNTFTPPENFREHTVFAQIDLGEKAGPELFEKPGLRSRLHLQYSLREGAETWGRSGFEKKVSRFGGASIGSGGTLSISPSLSVAAQAQGSFITQADRLNALRDLNLAQETLGLLQDFRAKQATTAELGLKWINQTRKFGLKPFSIFSLYREVLVDRDRNNWGAGGGVKLMGRVGQSFFWDIVYAAAWHLREDIGSMHEIRAGIVYRFL